MERLQPPALHCSSNICRFSEVFLPIVPALAVNPSPFGEVVIRLSTNLFSFQMLLLTIDRQDSAG